MTTIIGKISSNENPAASTPTIVLRVCVLVGLGVAVAYMNGVLEGNNATISAIGHNTEVASLSDHGK